MCIRTKAKPGRAKEAEAVPLANSKLRKKISDSFDPSLIWRYVIWPISGLKNWLWYSKTSKSHT